MKAQIILKNIVSVRGLLSLVFTLVLNTLVLNTLVLSASVFAESVEGLQKGWAIANYKLQDHAQEQKFLSLVKRSEKALQQQPNNPELLIWDAIIRSTFAGTQGGLGALRLVKAARNSLELAIEIDDSALNGSAYTSLGSLYAQVPGWPIAFGNDKKARLYLEKALVINPGGIDANYFYAKFLIDEKDFRGAKIALLKARNAPSRSGRAVADAGRQAEVEQLLTDLEDV